MPSNLSGGTTIARLRASQVSISRVNPANKTLLVGNLEHQSGKRVALLLTESGEKSILMLPRHFADLFQDFATTFCQVHGIQAPVMGVCSPLHESLLLKVVQNRHQAAGVNL